MGKALKLIAVLALAAGLHSLAAQRILAPVFLPQPASGGGSSPSYVAGGGEDCTAAVGNGYNVSCTATTTAVGRTLEVIVRSDGGPAPNSITDSNGTLANVSVGNSGGGGGLSVYQVVNAASGAHTIQANWSSGNGGGAAIIVLAYGGANSSAPLDATPSWYGGTFGMSSGGPNCGGSTGASPYTTANAHTSVITVESTTASSYPTAPTGFTIREEVAEPDGARLAAGDNAPSPGTGTAASGTAFSLVWGSTNNYWGCMQYAIKP